MIPTKKMRLNSNKYFDPSWETQFLFIKTGDNKSECIICQQVIQSFKKSNIERHYRAYHGQAYDNISGEARDDIIFNYKLLQDCQSVNKENIEQLNIIKASYIASYEIARSKKTLSEGLFIKDVCVKMLNCLGNAGKNVSTIFLVIL